MPQKKSSKSNVTKAKSIVKKNVRNKKSITGRLISFSVKLMIAMLFALGIYTIYLDAKVREKFEGQRWQVPVQIYGQLKKLQLGESENLEDRRAHV